VRIWRPNRSRALQLALTAPVLGVVLAVTTMTPASATTASYTNPASCSASVQNGVCISGVSADYGTSTVSLGMTVGQATDPDTDPNWLNTDFNTEVVWLIAVGGSTTASYVAEADSNFNSPGTFSGIVFSATTFDTLCAQITGVDATFSVSSNEYDVSFPASCIQSPSSLSVQATRAYDTNSDSLGTIASAPGTPDAFVSCCTVTPDTTTPTSTTTTTTTPTSSTSTTSTSSTTSTTTVKSTSSTSSTTSTTVKTSAASAGATTTTDPTSAATTTSQSPAAVTSSPSSTGNTGSGSSGLAVTGSGDDLRVLVVAGLLLLVVGTLGRRRVLGAARRTKGSRAR
jgi:hypothetical protein